MEKGSFKSVGYKWIKRHMVFIYILVSVFYFEIQILHMCNMKLSIIIHSGWSKTCGVPYKKVDSSIWRNISMLSRDVSKFYILVPLCIWVRHSLTLHSTVCRCQGCCGLAWGGLQLSHPRNLECSVSPSLPPSKPNWKWILWISGEWGRGWASCGLCASLETQIKLRLNRKSSHWRSAQHADTNLAPWRSSGSCSVAMVGLTSVVFFFGFFFERETWSKPFSGRT